MIKSMLTALAVSATVFATTAANAQNCGTAATPQCPHQQVPWVDPSSAERLGYGYGVPAWGWPSYGYALPRYGQPGVAHAYRDRDGDGIANRYDRDRDGDGVRNRDEGDRDGDGVRNRYDDRPRNPYRR